MQMLIEFKCGVHYSTCRNPFAHKEGRTDTAGMEQTLHIKKKAAWHFEWTGEKKIKLKFMTQIGIEIQRIFKIALKDMFVLQSKE